jgi:hypothetical protein
MDRKDEMDDERNHDSQTIDESASDEAPVDLNVLFTEEKRDLNRLFPDTRLRRFLKDVRKNQRDVERFLKRLEIDDDIPDNSGGSHEVS